MNFLKISSFTTGIQRVLTMLLFLLISNSAANAADKRFALVVGNSAYTIVKKLPNAVNDAHLIAATLTSAGFEVQLLLDATEDALGDALDTLAERVSEFDVVAFYFAGHGMQKDGQNFLIPVDAELKSVTSIERETIGLQSFLDVMEQAPIGLIFLDACRDNPFAEELLQQSADANRSARVGRGLAVVRTRGDLLVTFATLPNTVASDGANNNSPFARALAKHIPTENVEISVLMKRVTRDVLSETDGEQRPQLLSQMQREFYFNTSDTTNAPVIRDDLKTVLSVYPLTVSVGEEVSVLADAPGSCTPSFFNQSPSKKITPIPLRFFKVIPLGRGQTRYEISPGSRYGLVVQEQDEVGDNKIGFFCEPAGMAGNKDAKIALLRELNVKLDNGDLNGKISSENYENVAYRFSSYSIK